MDVGQTQPSIVDECPVYLGLQMLLAQFGEQRRYLHECEHEFREM